jgi:hypothetical protein
LRLLLNLDALHGRVLRIDGLAADLRYRTYLEVIGIAFLQRFDCRRFSMFSIVTTPADSCDR